MHKIINHFLKLEIKKDILSHLFIHDGCVCLSQCMHVMVIGQLKESILSFLTQYGSRGSNSSHICVANPFTY